MIMHQQICLRVAVFVLVSVLLFAVTALADEPINHLDNGAIENPARRVVILTDFPPLDVQIDSGPASKRSDPDDIQSMVRFLLYANEVDIEGLVATSATFANVATKQHILDILELYEDVDDNLRKHDNRFPTAEQLRSVTWQGASGSYAKPAAQIIGNGKDSVASEKIIEILSKNDERPVWFCVWGGSCDLAQALWKIKNTHTSDETDRIIDRARVYLIGLQDGSGQWLLDTFPNLFIIAAKHTWQGIFCSSDLAWLNANVRTGHGALGAIYPTTGMGTKPGVKEGDSPSYLIQLSAIHGLNDPEHPNEPSWGGRFTPTSSNKKHWTDCPQGAETVRRWSKAFDNEFAARMDWCVKDYREANHAPIVSLIGEKLRDVRPGELIKLKGDAVDPDGNSISCKWYQDVTDESAQQSIAIEDSDSLSSASFVVPNLPDQQIYLILEVTDDGSPPLVGYQNLVFNIKHP